MKNIYTYLLTAFVLSFNVCDAQFGTIKIAFMGNSYCNGCCVPVVGSERPDAYRYKVRQRFELYYTTVTEVKLCLGGEDITDAMPNWYPGNIPTRNIDAALASNPDLILIEYAGNHFADLVPYDTIKWCYQYIADTLTSLGKRFIFTSSMPRKTTFDAPLTYVEYQDTAIQFNTWLYANYPENNVNVFTNLYDPAINKPVFGYLGSDSLHWNATGYTIIADDIFEGNKIIDTLVAFERPRLYNVSMEVDGDSIEISAAKIRAKNIKIYTSVNGVTYNEVYDEEYVSETAIMVEANNYVKLVAINNEKTVTFTKSFIE